MLNTSIRINNVTPPYEVSCQSIESFENRLTEYVWIFSETGCLTDICKNLKFFMNFRTIQ